MTRYIFLYCLTSTVWSGYAQPSPFAHPESIIAHDSTFLVSNIGQRLDTEADGDGFVVQIDAQGKVTDPHFLPRANEKLNAPKGMAIVGGTLYVADLRRVVGFDLATRAQVWDVDLSAQAQFLNDLLAIGEDTLLVSDSFADRVFAIRLADASFSAVGSAYPGANGLTQHRSQVYVAGMGTRADGSGTIRTGQTPVPSGPVGVLDGLQSVDEQRLLISDWVDLAGSPGKLYLYDTERRTVQTSALALVSPADFCYDRRSGQVLIPSTLEHRVVVRSLSELFPRTAQHNHLFHYGLIDAFLGGFYDGDYSYGQLKTHGNFGLGAPDRLDGEVTVLDGKVYQTYADGSTVVPPDSARTCYAFVTDFSADTTLLTQRVSGKEGLEAFLRKHLPHRNGMYAIKITGTFTHLKTRAFPPVSEKPYPALATLLDRQRFFELASATGTLVGFWLPAYLEGVNIPGFHFHFVSADERHGGHVLEVTLEQAEVQIDQLTSYEVLLPNSEAFRQIDLTQDRSADLEKAESGGQ